MPTPRLHPPLRLIVFGCLSLIILLVTQGVIVGAIQTASVLTGIRGDALALEFQQRYGILLALFAYPALLVCLIYCRRSLDRRSTASLGIRMGTGQTWKSFFVGAMMGACAITLLCAILWVVGGLRWEGWSPEVFVDDWPMAIGMLSLYALAFFTVGFMEELLFRGYLLHNLNAWLGFRPALLLHAIIFAAFHLGNSAVQNPDSPAAALDNWRAMPNLFLISLFFGLCYRKTGSLWFPIGFHAAWNFFQGNVLSIPVSGLETFRLFDVWLSPNALLSGGAFGVEGSLLLIPLTLAMLYFVSRLPDHPQALLDMEALKEPHETTPPAKPPIPPAPATPSAPEPEAVPAEATRPTAETVAVPPPVLPHEPPGCTSKFAGQRIFHNRRFWRLKC